MEKLIGCLSDNVLYLFQGNSSAIFDFGFHEKKKFEMGYICDNNVFFEEEQKKEVKKEDIHDVVFILDNKEVDIKKAHHLFKFNCSLFGPFGVMEQFKAGEDRFLGLTKNGILCEWGENENRIVMENVASFSISKSLSTCITKIGELYVWKHGKAPTKVMENVKDVFLGRKHCLAITKEGILYAWGDNSYGQLGVGHSILESDRPIKVMENVESFPKEAFQGDASLVITKGKELYAWGINKYGGICDGSENCTYVPTKIIDNIKEVFFNHVWTMAITEKKELYSWGYNYHGQLGFDKKGKTYSYKPTRVMKNVKTVSLGLNHSACITENDILYTWGRNEHGQLGDDSMEDSSIPIKIMENVKTIHMGDENSACTTKDGSFYTWGDNINGQLGDGTTMDQLSPAKIYENVLEYTSCFGNYFFITKGGNLYCTN